MKYLVLIALFLSCGDSTLFEGSKARKNNIENIFFLSIRPNSATLVWNCEEEMDAYATYGRETLDKIIPSLNFGKSHIVTLTDLIPQTDYIYTVSCGNNLDDMTWMNRFQSAVSDDPIKTRGIWLLGGIGTDGNPISQIDLYDPVENRWYPNITQMPTPRAFANIIAHKNKIYVMGGLIKSGPSFNATDRVDEYDPFLNLWKTLSPMPNTHQSGNSLSVENSIVIIAGTTSEAMQTGTLINTVYEFSPSNGDLGTWTKYVSNSAIFQRIDIASCNTGGSLFFAGGRRASDGSPFASSDGYIPGISSTTFVVESSLNVARHGSAAACYIPNSKDPFPSDPPAILIAGGSTSSNLIQPSSGILPTNSFEYSRINPSAFNSYAALPSNLYYPSMEISYDRRSAFVFGGETSLGNLSDMVFSLDLSAPATSQWQSVNSKMPLPRYGHKSILLSH
ncbi:kelch repeat protein [Leptospira weilii str. 2006001855]|uniref:Kelch repeat protein n=1 Tax=Leptospira weilii str. 2006001855 TaxID=996804 RepID=M6FF68_9LEPT|nr:kelch repeat-containing protein [Leptospira weilii]EMM71050.1 kelch repeat protein [Leptospira weilii str. 2006001855]